MPSAFLRRRELSLVLLLYLLLCCLNHAFGADASTKLRQPVPTNVVVLTFDDSVKSHFTVARPLLKKLGFHATFFITEGFDFPTNKQDYMTWEEIRQLHDDGFEIGNHTRDHMGITAKSVGKVREQLEAINERCRAHGIPVPVSLAYPGNAFHVDALPILESMGIRYARRGGSPEYTYEEGGGVAYEPGRDHPLLIPSAGDGRPNWSLVDFTKALGRARAGSIPVLQFHGVPDRAHPWVNTPTEQFVSYMTYLKTNNYAVLALRDLERYVGTDTKPANPQAVIDERIKQRGRGSSTRSRCVSPPATGGSDKLRVTDQCSRTFGPRLLSRSASEHKATLVQLDCARPAVPAAGHRPAPRSRMALESRISTGGTARSSIENPKS